MSSDTGIVSSAASRGKPQPIRSAGNTHGPHREQKESKMFINGLSSSRGFSVAAAALAGLAAGVGLAGTASASVIYQDSFPGLASASLNGTSPTTDATGATWTADTAWNADGSVDESGATTGAWNAYLPFTPASGRIYTLSEGINATGNAPGASNSWIGLAFLASGALGVPLYATSSGAGTNAAPLVIDYVPNSGAQVATFASPSLTNANATSYQGTGVQNLQMVLNTGAPDWAVQFRDNGVNLTSFTYTTTNPNPTIADVGFGTSNASGQVSSFELTSAPVPEPATLGLFALGGLGLLLASRKRKARA